jgi:hypothetical protein
MFFPVSVALLALPASRVLASPVSSNAADAAAPVNVTACNGKTYTYSELAGYGKLASDARDKFGDTIGGIGSAIALDKKSWTRKKGSTEAYQGIIYGLPDRGWNTEGTQNTQSRIHKFSFELDIVKATIKKPASPNFKLTYLDTILLTGPDGERLTGLDPTGSIAYNGFPKLPLAVCTISKSPVKNQADSLQDTGNGFGQAGPGGARVALDTEGLVLNPDGTYFVSDEYGPYVYQFDATGRMLHAIRTPDALIPQRNGSDSFSAASPPIYEKDFKITPEDPTSGRGNNQGLEALTASPDGKYLYTMLQSATIQDGGAKAKTRRNTRLLVYSTGNERPTLEAEYVVQLPQLSSGRTLGQSEMHYISPTQFLVLARDSGAGHGQPESTSQYRNADIIDVSGATNVAGKADAIGGAIASDKGELKSGIVPAKYCAWLSYNVNTQLNRFGVRNGGKQDANLLNEKWESLALAPVDKAFTTSAKGQGQEYYLISFSDNDFITQNGELEWSSR